MKSMLIFLLMTVSAAAWVKDNRLVVADDKSDFSSFRTFVVREGDPPPRQPGSRGPVRTRTLDVDPKLGEAIKDAIRSVLSAKGMKETLESADLIVYFRIEVEMKGKEYPGDFGLGHPEFTMRMVVIDLTLPTTNNTIWHGAYVENEESPSKIEKKLPDDARKLLSEYPPKKKR